MAQFIEQHDPERERYWIAVRDGESLGSVFLVKETDDRKAPPATGRAPSAGARHRHTPGGGVRRVRAPGGLSHDQVWTNSVLHAARRVYERAGYRLVDEGPHYSLGHDLVGETWELQL